MKFNQLLSKINEQMNVGSGTAPARGAIQRVKELSNKPRLPPINSLKYGPVRTESVEPGKELAIIPKSQITTTNQLPNPNLPVLGGQIGRVGVRVTGTTPNELPGSTTPPKSRGDMIRALNAATGASDFMTRLYRFSKVAEQLEEAKPGNQLRGLSGLQTSRFVLLRLLMSYPFYS